MEIKKAKSFIWVGFWMKKCCNILIIGSPVWWYRIIDIPHSDPLEISFLKLQPIENVVKISDARAIK